ncbi:MAG: Holliday junction branch migration protein RuvA [Limosilactobacillus sp.]|nr:Holliday junction branch migration protein RuvA [Limosilactobacillus sp.]
MFNYLNGLITAVTPDYIVVDINGVGYQVAVANPYAYTESTTPTKVYIYQAVREDAITLYGFQTLAEKQLFLQLISVSGIGPKSALAILATPDHAALAKAINEGNDTFLAKFPGIGKKTAGRIIVELKDRVQVETAEMPLLVPETIGENQALADALAALKALGYTDKQVQKVEKSLATAEVMTTSDYISAGLKLLI